MHTRRATQVGLGLVFLLAIVVTIVVSIWASQTVSGACKGPGTARLVNIRDAVAPQTIRAERCDTLVFKNADATTREIAFGPHDNHVAYNGIAERFLNKNQSFSVQLTELGTFHWHDHLHDGVEGYFIVVK